MRKSSEMEPRKYSEKPPRKSVPSIRAKQKYNFRRELREYQEAG